MEWNVERVFIEYNTDYAITYRGSGAWYRATRHCCAGLVFNLRRSPGQTKIWLCCSKVRASKSWLGKLKR